MTIVRVNTIGWGVGDKVTSAQLNAMDINGTYALDKRSGQTDVLQSIVTLAVAGRFVQGATNTPNADASYAMSGQILYMRVGAIALTAQRAYTLQNTGAVTGDEVLFFFEPSNLGSFNVLIKDNGGTTIATLGPTGDAVWGEFKFMDGAWKVKRLGAFIRRMRQVFTANGNWVKPAGFVGSHVELEGHGAGGGGGGPANVTNGTDVYGSGGAGGAGAQLIRCFVDVSAVAVGGSVPVTIGTGGAAGASPGSHGGAGGDTIFDVAPPTVQFPGGIGGSAGRLTTDASRLVMALGGTPTPNSLPNSTASGIVRQWEPITGALFVVPPLLPGQGGHAGSPNTNFTFNGALPTGQLIPGNGGIGAGIAGTKGTDDGTRRGGGAGGGGGAGPSGAGGNGGNGGSGNAAGVGTASSNGASAAANSGGGGGGAGGTGHGSSGLGVLSSGGAGGSGQLIVWWWEKRPIP